MLKMEVHFPHQKWYPVLDWVGESELPVIVDAVAPSFLVVSSILVQTLNSVELSLLGRSV